LRVGVVQTGLRNAGLLRPPGNSVPVAD
jgi:hypothetical protein